MQCSESLEQHEWLRQLLGDWNVTADMQAPDGNSKKWESQESIRAIGNF